MRRLFWLVVGFMIGGGITAASAEEIAATPVYTLAHSGYNCTTTTHEYPSAEAAYADYIGRFPRECNGQNYSIVNSTHTGLEIWRDIYWYYVTNPSQNGHTVGIINIGLTWRCPDASWQLNGQTCSRQTCEAGKFYNGYTTAVSPAIVCFGGCEASIINASNQYRLADGTAVIAGKWSGTGEHCSGGAEGVEGVPDGPCPGQCSGTLNGQTICHACGEDEPVKEWDAGEKTSSNPDGTTTTEKTVTETTTQGTTVTRTTTVTTGGTDAQGNPVTPTTQTEQSEGSKNKFCEENPEATICKNGSASGGNDCLSAPVCEGDAIQCAILRKQWEQWCQLQPLTESNDAAAEYEQARQDMNTPQDIIEQKSVADVFTLGSHVTASAECPADIVIPVFGYQLTAPIAWLCAYLGVIALVVKALAWLFVGRLIMGAL